MLLTSHSRWPTAHWRAASSPTHTRETCCTVFLEEVHRDVPWVRVDQHVDDLAQCAVGHQTEVIKQMVEAAEIITFACEPCPLAKSTTCCSDVTNETLLRRGLLELGINFAVTKRTCDLGVDTGGGSRRAVLMRKQTPVCKAAKRSKRLAVTRRHTKKASSLHSNNIWPCSSFGAAGMGIAPTTMQGVRSGAADAVCSKSGRLRPVLPLVCPAMLTPPCRPGLGASSGGWFSGKNLTHARAQSMEAEPRAAPRREFLFG